MDVQLGIHGQIRGCESFLTGQPAHGQHKGKGSGIVPVFGNPEQGRKQGVGNVNNSGFRFIDAGYIAYNLGPQHHGPANDIASVGRVRAVQAADIQDALQAADEIRSLHLHKGRIILRTVSGIELLEGVGGAARENKHSTVNDTGFSLGCVFAVLHRSQKIPEPSSGNSIQFAVKLVEKHQRYPSLCAVDRFIQSFKEILGITALGKVDGGHFKDAAGCRDLPDAERLS